MLILANPRAALELARGAIAAARDLPLSIGLSHGPVRVVEAGAGRRGVTGEGIAEARVMAGQAASGQVLESRSFRDALAAETARRRFLLRATAAAAGAMLALGLAARIAIHHFSPASLELDIRPEGDVFVDGVFKGTSPPLARVQLASGKHSIEIRNARYRSHVVEVDVEPGEALNLRHSFTAAAPARSAVRRFFDRFK